jgi:cell division protease FtsH
MSKKRLLGQITSLFGGRVAEELIFGKDAVTTGASNDIERATEIARNMVTKWGLSEKLGPLAYSEEEGEVFLGRSVTQTKQISDVTAKIIDEEIRHIIDDTYKHATLILNKNIKRLHKMSEALLKFETIEQSQIEDIMNDKEPRLPDDWENSDESNEDNDQTPNLGDHATQH